MEKYREALEECSRIAKERELLYWDVEDNFSNIQNIHNAIFENKLTKEQLVEVMISTKLARELNQHKTDNLLDLINYTAIYNKFKK